MSGLTEAEKEALWIAAHTVEPMADTGAALFAAVERILAERIAQAPYVGGSYTCTCTGRRCVLVPCDNEREDV